MRRLILPTTVLAISAALFQLVRLDIAGTISGLAQATRDDLKYGVGILFWLAAAWFANSIIAVAVVRYARRRNAGAQLPRLLIDLGKLVVYFLALLVIISEVFGKSLSGLLATSGFLAAFIGLALQKTISDAIAGISLNTEQVIKIGDWIETSTNVIGRVREITWRATYLVTVDGRQVVVPNSLLVTNQLINLNAPFPHFRMSRSIRTDYTVRAERVMAILQSAMEATQGVLSDPAPRVLIDEVLEGGIRFSMNFWVLDYGQSAVISRDVTLNALKFLDRAGIVPSLPRQDVALIQNGPRYIETGLDVGTLLRRTPFFQSFTPSALERLEREAKVLELSSGSIVVREGEPGASLFIVVSGLLLASKQDRGAEIRIVGRLMAGDVLGEMSLLTGAPRSATVTARTDITLLEISKEQIEPILSEHPEAITELSRLQAERFAKNQDALALSPDEQKEVRAVGMAAFLGKRIRRFFNRA